MTKIYQLIVDRCAECPALGGDECMKENKKINDIWDLPEWCPLEDE